MPTPGAIQQTVQDSNAANDWVRKYLKDHGLYYYTVFDTSGSKVMFDGKQMTMEAVVKTTLAAATGASDLAPGSKTFVADTQIRRIAAEILYSLMPHSSGASAPPNVTLALQYTFTPTTVHTPGSGGPDTKDQPAHSVAAQATFALHGKDESGFEIQGFGQATWFADDKGGHLQNQSGFAGAQVAWVWQFLNGNLQAGPIFQAMVGASRAQQTVTNKVEWTPTGQVSAGGQIQYQVPGTNGHVLVGVQAVVSGTDPKGSASTIDRSAGFTLTFQF